MSIYRIVQNKIKEHDYCLKNDYSLCFEVWNQECKEMGLKLSEISSMDILKMFSENKLAKRETILRYKRKIVNKNKTRKKNKNLIAEYIDQKHDNQFC